MSIKLPVIIEYNGKGAKQAQGDLASLAKSYARNALSAAGVVEVARQSIMAANEDAAAQKQLALALRNNAGANDYAVAKTEKFIAALQYQVAVADDQLRPALATLATVTHDVGQAQDLLQVALDVSAARGLNLENVALGLSKAYQGNIGALRRMGIAVSDTAIKNKDFAQALSEIKVATHGAAAEAAKGAQGGWKKLGIAVQDLSEILGNELNKNLAPAVTGLSQAAKYAAEADQKTGWFAKSVDLLKTSVEHLYNPLSTFIQQEKDSAKAGMDSAEAQAALASRNRTSLALQSQMIAKTLAEAEALRLKKERLQKVREAAKLLADTYQNNLKNALTAVQDGIRDYIRSIGDAISANVSLSDSVSKANASVTAKEDALQAAIDKRTAAYEALNMAQQTNDVEAYNKALQDVAKAEGDVSAARAMKTTSYTEQFRSQVAAAKEFAGNLQKLIASPYNLSQAGVSQLLDLGAVAGNQVAKDLLAGTAGLTVGEVNQSLADVQAAGEAAGMATPGYGAILGANVGRTGNKVYITVNTGVGDKNAISKQIVELLQDYDRTMGGVPIRTS